MTKLSTQPYKGTRDYYPEDKRVQNYIFHTWHKVAHRFGYEEYDAPLLEPLDLYAAKTGQEIVNEQTYQFTDRGDRTVAIRPEMTPSVSRMIAAKRQEVAYPARWYSIANFMRYERPQRGREREFWQLNTDIFGVDSIYAEFEMIQMADALMKEFGAADKMYVIKVNDRKLINYVMTHYLELDVVQSQLMIKLFDRREKMSPEEFSNQAADIFSEAQRMDGLKKVTQLIGAKTISDLPERIKNTEEMKDVTSLFQLLETVGLKNVKFDVTLMRGFDYYTGVVFEVFDNHPDNNRSMFGGGRYDGLVGLFGVDPIPTVGMAPGGTMTEIFLKSHKLLPDFPSTTEVCVLILGNAFASAQQLANQLREEGLNVEIDVTDRKLDKQIKAVAKKQIPYMIFVGEEEAASEVYTLKEVKTSKEEKMSFARIVTAVKDRRRNGSEDDDF